MAHAGRCERGDLQLKKLRKSRKKQESKLAEMEPEEREEYLRNKYEKTLKEKVGVLLWDYENHQLPRPKRPYLAQLAKERLLEITKEIDERINEGGENVEENYKKEIEQINKFLEVMANE